MYVFLMQSFFFLINLLVYTVIIRVFLLCRSIFYLSFVLLSVVYNSE